MPRATMGMTRSTLVCVMYSEVFSEEEGLLEFFKLSILIT